MIFRNYEQRDFNQVKEIHDKYYKHEFELEELFEKSIQIIVVVDNNDKIINICAARTIIELVAITNKDFSARKRVQSLKSVLQAMNYVLKRSGFNQLHAFIQDDNWMKHLLKNGFRPTKGQSVVIDLSD